MASKRLTKKERQERIRKGLRYIFNHELYKAWQLMDQKQKAYAHHLVSDYGYKVVLAIQQSYIFGFNKYAYNYKTNETIIDTWKY